jgi:hypothetical protein
MGASTFYNQTTGTNARELFNNEVEEARYENGNGGYTGTIAEKSDYTMSVKPDEIPAHVWIDMVEDFDEGDTDQEYYSKLRQDFRTYDDKWGDALCVPTKDGFIFCGWASD